MASRRSGMFPGRRLAFVGVLAVLAVGSVTATAAADQQIVLVTVYSASGTQQQSLSLAALEANSSQCPQYTGTLPVQHGRGGETTPNFTGGEVWALSTILSCLQPSIPSAAVTGVTIINADGTPQSAPGSQLTATDLAPGGTDFADSGQAPVIGNQGTASSEAIQYDRPWRGGADNNFDDQVTQSTGSPVAIEVFEGPLLTVTPHASATTVPAGGAVSFSVTFGPSNVTGASYSWSFDGGAANSTAAAPTVTFASAGTYNVTVQVTDDEGGGGTATIPITVTSSTPPPAHQKGTPAGPKKSGGKGSGQVPRKHDQGNGGHSHKGSHSGGSSSGTQAGSPSSQGTTPVSPGSPSGSSNSGSSTPAPVTPLNTHSVAPHDRKQHQTSHVKAPSAAPGALAPVVTGRLVSDVTPLPAGQSPLVHIEAGVPETSQAARSSVGGSALPAIGAALAVLALLGLGARRELRGGRDWRTLRFGS